MDTTTTRIEKAEAGMAELKEQIKTLEAEISEIDAAQSEATKIRHEEHEDNTKAMEDFKASAEACGKAIGVLNDYYGSSFVQVKSTTRRMSSKQPAADSGGAKSDAGGGIVSMLEVAESD